jgi:hypothetical protein
MVLGKAPLAVPQPAHKDANPWWPDQLAQKTMGRKRCLLINNLTPRKWERRLPRPYLAGQSCCQDVAFGDTAEAHSER